jgi:hypothetical protein
VAPFETRGRAAWRHIVTEEIGGAREPGVTGDGGWLPIDARNEEAPLAGFVVEGGTVIAFQRIARNLPPSRHDISELGERRRSDLFDPVLFVAISTSVVPYPPRPATPLATTLRRTPGSSRWPVRPGPTLPLRPWLAEVVRRLVHTRRRAEGRRRQREHDEAAITPRHSQPAATETAELLRLIGELVWHARSSPAPAGPAERAHPSEGLAPPRRAR